MDNFLGRISLFIEKEGVSVGYVEKKIGASKGVLYKAISNKTDISTKWVRAMLENFPHISSEWLLTGKGCMYKDEYKPMYDDETRNRIRSFCQTYGLSVDDFRKDTGLTLEGIAKKYPNLNPNWLLYGAGDMFIHSVGESATDGGDSDRYRKRVEELERLVEQKDRMLEILMGTKKEG
ncbi:MAG: hypothetical protein MJZ30_09905 [Paludibacteraceae bacterium]|nr:hypothetical protein [Paludibacteraceae bacterium]